MPELLLVELGKICRLSEVLYTHCWHTDKRHVSDRSSKGELGVFSGRQPFVETAQSIERSARANEIASCHKTMHLDRIDEPLVIDDQTIELRIPMRLPCSLDPRWSLRTDRWPSGDDVIIDLKGLDRSGNPARGHPTIGIDISNPW